MLEHESLLHCLPWSNTWIVWIPGVQSMMDHGTAWLFRHSSKEVTFTVHYITKACGCLLESRPTMNSPLPCLSHIIEPAGYHYNYAWATIIPSLNLLISHLAPPPPREVWTHLFCGYLQNASRNIECFVPRSRHRVSPKSIPESPAHWEQHCNWVEMKQSITSTLQLIGKKII